MRIATASLKSTAPYSQSRAAVDIEKEKRETAESFENRTWRHKCHTMTGGASKGHVFIPPMAFKLALDKAAQMLGRQIPGKGRTTYTKFFLSGVLVIEPLILPYTEDDAQRDRVYCHVSGIRGSGKRVWRHFPRFDEWEGTVAYHILAEEITPEVFEEALVQSGSFVGIGRFRPENGGYYGRFSVENISWNG